MFRLFAFLLIVVVCSQNCNAANPQVKRPNILFCIADDASYPHMGAYGCKWVNTPGFDRVAREGLLFNKAYTPNAKCAPSRACILTGRNSWQLKQAGNHWCFFPREFTTYAEALSVNGYFVGKTGKGWGPGIAKDAQGNSRMMAGKPFRKLRLKPNTSGISSIDYAANFQVFMKQKPKDSPWCFWYGGYEPHRKYEYGSGVKKGGKNIKQIDEVPTFWPDNEVTRNDMLDYAYEIDYFDSHLQKMLNELEKRGELDNTIVIVTADNGMPFPRVKAQEYEMSNHLPLAIMWKNGIAKPGRTIDDYVSFIDFAPTFLELAGLNAKTAGMQETTGRSLVEFFASDNSGKNIPQRNYVLIGKERHDVGRPNDVGYPIRGIIKNEMLFLINYEPTRWPSGNPITGYLATDGSPTKTDILSKRTQPNEGMYWQQCFGKRASRELFNLKQDPYCINNLISNNKYEKVQGAMETEMLEKLRQQSDPRVAGKGYIFDEYPYANPADRDFYNRTMKGEKVKAGWVNPSDFEKVPFE